MLTHALHFWNLISKELRILLKDGKSRMAIFMPPIMQLLIFGYAATLDIKQIDFVLLDHDHTAASRMFVDHLTGSGNYRVTVLSQSEAELADAVSNYEALCGIVIPRNFQRDLSNGTPVAIQALFDGRNSNTAAIASGYVAACVNEFNARYIADHPQMNQGALTLQTRAYYNPNYDMRYFMVPMLLVLISLLDAMLLTSLSIAREREDGTFDQIIVSPYGPACILAAKGATTVLVGLVQLTIVFFIGRYHFDVPFLGAYSLLYLGFIVFLFASTGCGLFVSILSKNLQQALLGTFMAAVPFALLSGVATPIENMPTFFQYLTLINPMRFGVVMMHRIFLEGAGFLQLWPYYAMMGAIGTAAYALAYTIFRRQLHN